MIYIIITCVVSLAVVLALITYYSAINVLTKLLMLPLLLLIGYFSYSHYINSLGAPINEFPYGKFQYVYHVIDSKNIILWAVVKEEDRLYIFKYTRDTAKKLNEAKKKKESDNKNKITGTFMTDKPSRILIMDTDENKQKSDNPIKE